MQIDLTSAEATPPTVTSRPVATLKLRTFECKSSRQCAQIRILPAQDLWIWVQIIAQVSARVVNKLIRNNPRIRRTHLTIKYSSRTNITVINSRIKAMGLSQHK